MTDDMNGVTGLQTPTSLQMALSPAEATLIEILRDGANPAYTISITSAENVVVVTMAIPGDSVNIGSGQSFEAAIFSLCGREMPATNWCDLSRH